MAENVTLARPYAEAAFALASKTKALAAWQDTLDRLAIVAADARMRDVMGNPKVSASQLVKLLVDVAGKVSPEQENFLNVLVENERVTVLPEIRDLFVARKNQHERVKQAHVTSAFALDDKALKQLIDELEPRFNCKLEVTVDVDPELIGGVRVAVGDEVIDASVRGKLATMATVLKTA
ncbi:MAG TPA: F0F1 ATP synthase subunit delta [Burkholderiales bacterium]|nr:F0F1 ATP synthase subunit delta [Burkholderiales bacterium]